MPTFGLPELVASFALVVTLAFYVFAAFVIWKFYRVFSGIYREIAEIRTILRDDAAARRALRE